MDSKIRPAKNDEKKADEVSSENNSRIIVNKNEKVINEVLMRNKRGAVHFNFVFINIQLKAPSGVITAPRLTEPGMKLDSTGKPRVPYGSKKKSKPSK